MLEAGGRWFPRAEGGQAVTLEGFSGDKTIAWLRSQLGYGLNSAATHSWGRTSVRVSDIFIFRKLLGVCSCSLYACQESQARESKMGDKRVTDS